MSLADRIDATTADDLHAAGSLKWSEPDLLGAWIAEMDFGVDPVVRDALARALDDAVYGYQPPHLAAALADATAAHLHDAHGWTVDPADVRPMPDVVAGLEFVLDHVVDDGTKVIVPTPAYMPFLTVPGLHGREIIELPMVRGDDGRHVFDLEGLQRAFDDGGRLLLLVNPANPVGRVFTPGELRAVAAVVERNDGRVFADEIWAPLVHDDAVHVPYADLDDATAGHAITALSASKAWNLPGLKCAVLVLSNDADRARMERVGMWAGHGTANPGIVATVAAFREGGPWLDEVRAYLTGNRDRLLELVGNDLPGVTMTRPEGTYVGWLDLRSTPAAGAPSAFFRREAGVWLTDGASCGHAGHGHARLIFATPRPVLEQIVARMATALAGAGRR